MYGNNDWRDYLEHARSHKYIKKIKLGTHTRYFYSPLELDAYYQNLRSTKGEYDKKVNAANRERSKAAERTVTQYENDYLDWSEKPSTLYNTTKRKALKRGESDENADYRAQQAVSRYSRKHPEPNVTDKKYTRQASRAEGIYRTKRAQARYEMEKKRKKQRKRLNRHAASNSLRDYGNSRLRFRSTV